MNIPEISMIVPAYNTEERIKACIDSVMKQTFCDYELIIIDDGSQDGTGAICDQYSNYKNVTVVHTENQGRTQARRIGVEMARGKYLGFLDSDDYLHEDFLLNMYKAAEEHQADIVECGFMRVDGTQQVCDCTTLRTGLYNKEQIAEEILPWIFWRERGGKNIQPSLCDKLFNREFFIKNILEIPVQCSIGEDGAITYGLMMSCERYVELNQPLYYYVQFNQERKCTYKRSKTKDLSELLQYYDDNECFAPYRNQIAVYISEIMVSQFLMIREDSFREDFEYIVRCDLVKEVCKRTRLVDCNPKQGFVLFLLKSKWYLVLSVALKLRLMIMDRRT